MHFHSPSAVALHTLERPVLDGPSPFSAGWKSAVQQSVDSFMLALPLGASEQDALIEEAVARQLYDAEIGKATLQKHLHDWCVPTLGLNCILELLHVEHHTLFTHMGFH